MREEQEHCGVRIAELGVRVAEREGDGDGATKWTRRVESWNGVPRRSRSAYWLELCDEAGIEDIAEREWLLKESSELLAISTSIGKTVKSRYRKPRL